jgi:hypothetical protein
MKPLPVVRQMDEDEAEHRRREAEPRRRDGDLSPDSDVVSEDTDHPIYSYVVLAVCQTKRTESGATPQQRQ